jgi:hypothetical protein
VRSEARFPSVPRSSGHYESFYLKAAAPEGGRALWIRHTVHKRPEAAPTCSVWFVLFERDGPRATKATFGPDSLDSGAGRYLRVEASEIGPGFARGGISTDALTARWDLSFSDRHEALHHLPHEWMYRARLPRTKLLSPHPGALFSGTLELDGERIELDGWSGMVGHNWGAEHAERWVWLHGGELEGGAPGDYLDIAAARIKLGPITSPWIANGQLMLHGRPHRLGGLGKARGTEIDARPGSCEFAVAGEGVRVAGRLAAPLEQFVGWAYADPEGGGHDVINCSIADLELEVDLDGTREGLRVGAGAAYELGMCESDHGVPIQPYSDG